MTLEEVKCGLKPVMGRVFPFLFLSSMSYRLAPYLGFLSPQASTAAASSSEGGETQPNPETDPVVNLGPVPNPAVIPRVEGMESTSDLSLGRAFCLTGPDMPPAYPRSLWKSPPPLARGSGRTLKSNP